MSLLTLKEAFEELRRKISLSTLYLAVEEKRLPHYRVSGCGRRGKILVKRDDLYAWLEGQKITPSAVGTPEDDPDEDEWP
ncbi:MAG TPA: helix-turn-helix domain-containing protein [Gemmataceae bacterium]|nr:helix-turn-helix domain-containing protein [Gemmataceae bacterium]